VSVDRLGSEILRSRSLFISEPSSPQVGRGAERSGRLLYLPFVGSDDEAPIFLEVARFMSANAVRVNHLDEVKGVSQEALDSGNPMMLDIGVHGTWPASPKRSSYLDLHRYLLPRHVHTDHRSWAKEPAET
jgi:hypothetical protein